jgi:2'-hydroxyisoflavone reductase
VPRVVRASAEALRGSVGLYVFVSSISAYADSTRPRITESDLLATLPDGVAEEFAPEHYGALKARCEAVLSGILPGRSAIVRAGLIQGRYDPTGRSSYWPGRMSRGGEVLAPGRPDRPVQLIDVRDLADWMVRMCEDGATGPFNATGPDRVLTMGALLETCRAISDNDARLTWVEEEFLIEQEVSPYNELPIWVPEAYRAFEDVDCSRAFAAGLRCRPLAETMSDILAWDRSRAGEPRPEKRFGVPIPPSLDPVRERQILILWHARSEAAGRSA